MSSADWRPVASLATLRLRAQLLRAVRAHFATSIALEVETPVLVGSPVTDLHLESLAVHRTDGARIGFLHTSPEYAMKRLLCAGAPDIFQITHVFREGERGRRHNPEFTMVEWYRLGIDHHELMDDVERLLRQLLEPHVPVGPTRRVTYAEAFRETLGLDPLACPTADIAVALERHGASVPASVANERDSLLDLAMATIVAAAFPDDRITFLYDFPASQAALAQVRGTVASRFEADGAERRRRGLPDRADDARFIAALAAGLPPCAGVALGFDRVAMIAAGAASIDEVLAFPIERA